MKIIAAILLALSFSASAESTYLYTEISQPGETMDAFVVRISARALKETVKQASEICGEVEEFDGGYRVVMATSGKAFSCDLPNTGRPYFHTHPHSSIGTFSHADKKYEGYLAAKGRVYYTNGRNERRIGKITSM